MATQYPLYYEAFILALSAFWQLKRDSFDAELVIKQSPPTYIRIQVEHALQGYGFSTRIKQLVLSKLNSASLPYLAILKPNSELTTNSDESIS